MMLLKMIDIWENGKDLTDEEIQLLLKNLEPGMKLPSLVDYKYPDRYPEQLRFSLYRLSLPVNFFRIGFCFLLPFCDRYQTTR